MNLYVIFGQRKESYAGQYGLEAIAVMTENDVDNNSDYLPDALAEHQSTGEFSHVGIVTIDVSEKDIRRRITPDETPVPGSVIGPSVSSIAVRGDSDGY